MVIWDTTQHKRSVAVGYWDTTTHNMACDTLSRSLNKNMIDVGHMANDIGLEAKEPKNDCSSSKCPWHGHLKVRGRIFKGVVVSSKPADTAIVEWDYYHYIPKYERYERKRTKKAAHNPGCINAKPGDTVRIAECRRLSKTKSFVVFEKI